MCFEPDPCLLLNISFKDDIGSIHVRRTHGLRQLCLPLPQQKAISFSSLLLKHFATFFKKQSIARALLIMVSTWSWSLEWSGSDQLDGLGHPLNQIRWSSHQQRQQQGFLRSRPNQPGRLSPTGTRDISFYKFLVYSSYDRKRHKNYQLISMCGSEQSFAYSYTDA